MKSTSIIKLVVVIMFMTTKLHSQSNEASFLNPASQYLQETFDITHSSGWLKVKPLITVSANNFQIEHKLDFNLGTNDNLLFVNENIDNHPAIPVENRLTHKKYCQTYKGIPIEHTSLNLHCKDNNIKRINAKLVCGLNTTATPSLTEANALSYAINFLGANNVYNWQDAEWVAEYRETVQDPNAVVYPKGDLLFAKLDANNDYSPAQFVLAWKFVLTSLSPSISKIVYVDASNGTIIKERGTMREGTAALKYYGNKTIDTKWRGGIWGHYILRTDDVTGRDIYTKKARFYNNGGLKPFGGLNVNNTFDQDDIWPIADAHQTTAHWGVTQAWDYFHNIHGRLGHNDLGSILRVQTDLNNDFAAAWELTTQQIHLGNHQGNTYAAIDVCGHEFTHGVIQFTAGLDGIDEPGALDESFADIFGFEVERYTQGGLVNDWIINEDLPNAPFRKINNPSQSSIIGSPMVPDHNKTQPSIYNGARWYTGINDRGGVHINSGVQNYWFYLLAEGSAGALDGTFNNINVQGIGLDKARNIAYITLLNLNDPNAQFMDSRLASIEAAITLFGECSNEVQQTRNAWAAVKIGSTGSQSIIGLKTLNTWTLGSSIINLPLQLTAFGDDAVPYSWSYSSNISGYVSGPNQSFFTATAIAPVANPNSIDWPYQNTWIAVKGKCVSQVFKINVQPLIYTTGTSGSGGSNNSNTSTNGKLKILIYPNPTHGIVNLESSIESADGDIETNYNYAILSSAGSLIQQALNVETLPSNIDLSNQPSGKYTIVVYKNGISASSNFIKE